MHVHRPVILLIATSVMLSASAGSAQAAPSHSTVIARPATADPGSTPGTGTRVGVEVLPLPSATPPTPPSSAPTRPSPTQQDEGGVGELPTTGMSVTTLLTLLGLGLGALIGGMVLVWTVTVRRRRSMS